MGNLNRIGKEGKRKKVSLGKEDSNSRWIREKRHIKTKKDEVCM